MKRKYLDDLGIKDRPDKWGKKDKRSEVWREQRKSYGFDERETWSLDLTFYLWLYERLKMYLEVASKTVDFTYHKIIYKDKEYTQLELIEIILERLEYFFTNKDKEDKMSGYVHEIEQIWAVILPGMWW